MVTHELQKEEAIRRMKMLKLHNKTIHEFVYSDIINRSENGGMLFWLNENEQRMVYDFELMSGGVVYHVLHNITEFGELYSLLYVSRSQDQWHMDIEDINDGVAFVYTINKTMEEYSTYGSIKIKPRFGGIVRTA